MESKYIHPIDGTKSHIFHHETVVPVLGKIATAQEIGVTPQDLETSLSFIGDLNQQDEEVLRLVRSHPVEGLSNFREDPSRYLEHNTVFISKKKGLQNIRTALSFPNSGRAVTRREGWVASNKQVLVHHNTKGVGKTRSAYGEFLRTVQRPGNETGVSMDASLDILGTNIARNSGVLTPVIYPSIMYEEVIFGGEKFPANEYFPEEKLYCIQRGWSSDIRLSGLYRGADASYFVLDDFDLIGEDVTLTKNVFRSRVNGFIRDVKKVKKFNQENQTNYSIGCSDYFNLDTEDVYEAYCDAFTQQMLTNIQAMITGQIWHKNFSMQNVSVGGEIGDWDSFDYISPDGVLYENGVAQQDFDLDLVRSKNTFLVFKESYRMISLINVVLNKGKKISASQWWDEIRSGLPQDSWASQLDMHQLIEKSISNNVSFREQRYDSLYPYEDAFADMSVLFKGD